MNSTPLVPGEVMRRLAPHFESTYDLNIAVNNYRRERGSKNWTAAAMALLAELEGGAL